jgi:hypothetical protein
MSTEQTLQNPSGCIAAGGSYKVVVTPKQLRGEAEPGRL